MKRVLTFSNYGIPGHYFQSNNYDVKIIIDPPKNYFETSLSQDRATHDKLILVHGCEPLLLNSIDNKIIKYHDYFDSIHSFSQKVLNSCNNSKLFCFGSCWTLTNKLGNPVHLKKDYHDLIKTQDKKYKISFVQSGKNYLPGHQLRLEISPLLKKKYKFEVLFPESIDSKYKLFKDSMFHIAIENSRCNNYFTEKIIDCFMTRTLPIYWGCPNILKYFNKNGIIIFNSKKQLKEILNNLTEKDYTNRIEAMEENYNIAYKNYAFFFDRVNDIIEDLSIGFKFKKKHQFNQ